VITNTTSEPKLSKYLFSALSLCVKKDAKEIMTSKEYLQGNSITYLQCIKTIYASKLSKPEKYKTKPKFLSLSWGQDKNIHLFGSQCAKLHCLLTKMESPFQPIHSKTN